MPDESCRKCGGLLLEFSICAKCRGPIQDICRICGEKTMERYHDGICFRKDELDAPKVKSNILIDPIDTNVSNLNQKFFKYATLKLLKWK